MTPLAPKASGTPWLARILSLFFLLLACFALPQQAAAQTSADVMVSIAADAASVAEDVSSGNATFTVSLSAAVDSDVVLGVTYAGGLTNPATPADDLRSGRPPTVTILQGQTRATITVPITDDDIVEVAETFTVRLSGTLPTGVVYGTQAATATITDTDSAVVSIGAAEISEGGTLAFPVSLSAPVSRDVTLTASTSNGTAAAGRAPAGDYTSVTNGAITFPANSVADVMFEVQTTDDRIPESVRETLTVTLTGTGLPARVTLSPTASTATGTIVDNESVLVSIEDMQAVEGQSIVFPITFTTPLLLLTITQMAVTATDGTDAPAADLQADLGTWPFGVEIIDFSGRLVTSGTYIVPTDDDNVVEGNETFRATLGFPGTEEEGNTPRVDRRHAIGTIIDNDTASVSLTPTATATEGDGAITFTVTLDNPVAEAFSLAWTATDGTATEGNDFRGRSGTVEIPALSQSVTFTIDITDDEAFEEEETFTVALSGAATGLVHIDPDRITVSQTPATGTITDDDAIFVSIADAPAVTEADNANARFTVTLSRAATEDVILNLEYTEVTATPATDLGAGRPTTVMISEGQTRATFDVPVINDDIVESNETFTVTVAVNTAPVGVFIEESVGTGTITDDDMATVSIAPTEASATEGNPVNFTVQLSQAVGEAITVTWTAAAGTGASPATLSDPDSDLGPNQDITGTAFFPAGATTAVDVAITTASDGIVEGAETFTVTLTSATPLPTGVTFGTQTATATITDSDMATVSITPAEASAAEGDPVNFTVQLSQAVNEAITVTWTAAAGTGASPATVSGPGSDLGPNQDITGTAFFPAGATTAVDVAITTANDAIVEGAETFTVTLTSATPLPDGVTFGTQTATATITEDETATVSIAPAEASAAEGNPFTFTVTLSRAAGRAVVLDVGYAPGATNPVTLADDLGSDRPNTVTIAAGELSASFEVPVTNDDRVEGDETFIVTLTAPDDLLGGVMIDDNNKSSTATITDSDTATVSLTPASPSAAENEPFTFTVTLSAPVSEDVNLTWTAREIDGDRAATIPIDLAESTDTLTIPKGSTNATFTIRPADDDLAEVDEIFDVILTAVGELPDRVTLNPNARRSRATIRDNEGDSSLIVLDTYPIDQVVRGESLRFVPGNIISVGFSLIRGNTGDEPLIVNVVPRNGNTLTEGEDYRLLSRQIVVPAHTSTFNGYVSAQLIDDSVVEIFTESAVFDFEVVSSHDARILNGIPADFTIEDTDVTRISLSRSASAVEGDMIVFTVELDNPVAKPFELTWTATDGTATVTDDLGKQSGTVTVPALSRTATISIPIVNDDALEGDENFTLTLTGTDGLDEPGDRFGIWPVRVQIDQNAKSATGTIVDNDEATVSISPSRATTAEGGTFTFRVTLSEPVAEDVTVAWTAAGSGGNAATLTGPGSDLADGQDISGTVTIRANTTTEQTITIATRNDTRDEGSETFTVTLSEPPATPLPGVVNLGTDSAVATATITDNNEATVSIGNASAAENAGPARFTVSLSQAVSRDVVLRVTYAAGSADPATDLEADPPATVTITANTTSATLVVPLNDDAIVEGTETFTVTVAEAPDSPLPDGVSIPAATASGTGTITENDTATVVITQATTEAAEGATFTFMAGLSAQVDEAVTVRWTAAPGTQTRYSPATVAGAGSDLADGQPATGTVTFAANDTTPRQFTITTRNDTRDEGSEAFTVTLSADDDNPLPDGVSVPDGATDAIITDRESGSATVSIFPSAATQPEGNPFAFEVRLSKAAEEPVTVTWTVAGSGGNAATVTGDGSDLADGQDFTGTVTFTAGDTTAKTVTIATIDDALVEGTETFTVRLTGTLPDGVEFATSSATATITETDTATVSLSPLSPSVAEGGTFTFTATLSAPVSEPVTVRWTAASGTATVTGAGSDLASGQATTATVTFPADSAANATQTFTIATANDTLVEGSETFTVTLGEDTEGGNDLPDGVTVGDDDEATATITETDAATVTLSPLSPSVAEGGTFTFTATLSAPVSEPVTVRWTAASGTATVDGAGSDLASGQATTATVTFPADSAANATQTFTIATNNDDLVEGSETFTVTLGEDTEGGNDLPDGVTVGADDEATATITETDAATVTLSPLSPSAAEGGTFTFTATLSAAVSEPVTVRWTAASGTATVTGPNSDLASGQATTATVTFPADSAANATQTFTIATANDTRVEGSETFTVTLGEDTEGGNDLPDGVEIGSADEATATITETDAATVTLSPLSPSAAEGGTFTFTATLSASVSEPVTVRWTAASGTATVDGAGSDLASGQDITNTVTFPANSAANATQTFTIATNNDDLVEGSETFTVTLGEDTEGGTALPDGVEIGSADEATATITDNDLATVTRFPGTASLFEGTTFSFQVRLNRAVSKPVTVRWTATATGDNPATLEGAGSDLASGQDIGGTVTFPAGSTTTQTFDIVTLNDTVVEGDETFTVTFDEDPDNPLPDGVSIGSNDTTAATIIDNDPAFVTRFPGTAERIEGGTINFQVRLNRAVSKPVTVRWTATATGDNPATLSGPNSDLASGQVTTGTVTFPAGNNTTQTIEIATRDDGVIEGDETFTVTYDEDPDNPLPGGVTYLGSDTAEATIVDNDTATVSLSPLSPSAAEGGTFTFTATLSASVPEAVTVRWTAASGTATVSGAGSDLASGQATTGTVTFQANGAANATQTFTIATNNDTRVEGSETFTVTLGEDTAGGNDLPTGVEIGDDDEAAATIADNDGAVTLSPLSPSAAEGGTFTFTATLSASVSEPVTVRWTATATGDNPATVTAGANADLGTGQAATGTVTFPADSAANATQTFTIVTADDDRVEGSETFTVTLGEDTEGGNDLPDGITVGDDNEATATITDRDAARVSLFPLSPPVVEGGMFTFTVRLNRTVTTAPVTVRWTATATGTGDGHATLEGAGSDLASGQVLTGTVEFPANSAVDARRTFTIATNNDTLVEGSETFTVSIAADPDNPLPDGVSIGDADEAEATITEGDRATVTIFPGTVLLPEGSTFPFQVRMSAAVSKPVTVRWTATATGDNAATLEGAGSDLASGQATTGTVTFPAGSTTTQTFDIVTRDDAVVEGDETFTVTFDEDPDNPLPDSVSISNDDTTAVTIDENDFAFVEGYPGTATWFEGETFSFEVRMNRAVSKPVTVRWTATVTGTGDGHATLTGPNSDLASGQATTGTVTFLPGDNTTQTFDIATRDDAVVWIDETFTVTFDADPDNPLPDGVSISNAHDTTAATILEDDAAVVTLSPLSPSAAEGGTFTFTATLNASVASPVTVRWAAGAITAPGGATLKGAGSDLASGQATTATVTFPANSAANATQTFTIATANDARVEGSETFKVSILADDDTALPYKVTVGDTVGSGDRATVTITDDDAATVTLSPLSPSAAEGGTFTFTATLSASVSEPVTVRWTAASGTATVDGAGSDLASGQATTATVTFPADSAANATQTFTIATNNDDLVEGSETFTVSIAADSSTPLPDGVTVGSADEATATITETDAATVTLSPLSPSAAEGGTFTFTATLSASVSEPVTVRWTAASGTATVDGAGSDLASGQDITNTVTFPANSAANATQTFTIATNNDDLVEGSETFTVTLGEDTEGGTALPDGVTVGSADEATATITETDAATVTLSPLSPSAAEGGTFTFTATLSASVSEPVTVRWTAASGTATVTGAGSDLASGQATTATVTFPANSAANATQTFTIATNNDDLVEGSETFTVTLSPDDDTDLPDGVTVGSADEATATITETDVATVSLSPLSPSVAEGGTFMFTATLSASVSEPVTVRWTAASGTATVTGAGSDLASGQATTATVTFPADSAANATQTFTIATNNDDLVEGSETFTVTLGEDTEGGNDLPDGVEIGSADEATATITETDAATVTLSPLSPSAAEGGTFTFTATLSASVSEPVTVRWTAASGTATVTGAGSDLASGQATTATVTFPADSAANATQTFTIATANDTRVEGSETFTVSIAADSSTPLPDGVTVGSADEATATITETDAATVTLSPLSPSAAEGGTFTFTATLSASVSEPVTVRWTAASGTATVTGAGSDLASGQATTATVTFPADSAANATQTFTIATNNDDLVEGSETFTVSIAADDDTALPDGVEIGSADEATATITETDAATVTLSPLSPSAAEGGTFTFTATLSASVSEPVTVRWTAASGTATVTGAGSDLASGQDITNTVTFPADSAANATQTFTIATNNDDLVEGSETFTVTLSPDDDTDLPDGVTVGSADEATATITETDAATVTLSPLSPSVAEGGTFTFTATLSASVSEPVTVRWTATSGTATLEGAGSDLASGQATTATVTFPADSAANATQTFTIATNNDDLVEGSETFTVSIAADSSTPLPDGVTVGSADEATATITETDAATVTLSPLSPSVAEGGTFTFTATLSASVSEPVTVRWTAASGTATVTGAGSDLASGQATTATVTFPADSAANATQTFTIATANDTRVEGSETFTVTLGEDTEGGNDLPDGVTVSDDDEATATITETDAATVTLSPLSPSAAEGGTFTFTATLSASVSEPVTVRWTAASGTATVTGAGSDLASGQDITNTVTFPADSAANATQTFTIATNNDDLVEGSETFTVSIAADDDTALPDGVEIGSADEATATITETDAATVTLSPLSPSAAEGGTFTFTATLSASVSEPVTVRWTAASGTATVTGAGSDLASGQDITNTVTFPADSAANATQTFTIATNNDDLVEGSETFTVSIAADDDTALPDGVEIGSADEATATITETDAATVTLSPLSPSAAEGGTFTFTATLSASVSEPVTVRWTAASGTATVTGAGSDLASGQATTATVTFPADSAANATQTFTIATANDTRVEGSETFTVTLGEDTEGGNDLPDGVEIGSADEATATITETDAATVTLSPLSPSAAEGGTFTFTATLSASVSEPVTVRWTAASGTATVTGAGSDLASGQDITNTVTFPADSAANATQTFTIATNNDDLVEGSETFTVSIAADDDTALPDGVEIGSADEATATITETDAATVTLSPLSPSAAEGGTFTFTATLSASVSEPVTVRWTAASGTATVTGAGSDLASGQDITNTVTFPADSAANATQTFTIATNNDDLVEGSETFTVSIAADDDTALPDGVEIGSADEATATITETDAATVTLSPLSPSAAEGGTFTFTATLSASVSEPVTVRWTAASGTATVTGAGSDLASGQDITNTVTFPADSAANATQTFTIATNNDDLVEGSETFTVSIAADDDTALPDGVEIGSADEATATITETDAATVTLSPLSPSAAEGGTFTFTATLSASVSEPVTVRWTAASGTATVTGAGSDLASGQATTATVTFPADSAANATQTFTIATANDTRVEGSETFTVTLGEDTEGGNDLPDGVEIGSADEATATITETDAATVTLSPLSPSAAEGGTFTFTATLSASVSEPVTVRWTAASGTATVTGAGSDLASGQDITNTVTFPADSAANATQTFTIATNNDDLVEGSETFTVSIAADDDTALPDGVEIGSADEATATITETDAATVTLSPLSPSAAEGGTFTFTATLSASVSEPVTVRWTAASGTATVTGAGSDLASGQDITNTVTFPADSAANATQTFTIATNNDDLVEGSETFTVSIAADDDTALPDGVEIGSADEATATITETDAATVTLSPLSPSAAEGGTFTFTATLSASVSEPVTVRWTAASGTATVTGAGSDLASGQDITNTVTFPADSAANATQTFTIATNNDDLVEGSETFTVSIAADDDTALPDGVEIGSADEATATITETDAATVTLSPLSPSAAEGGTFTFTATLSASVSEPVTVRWTAASGTATVTGAGSDLASGQDITNTVTFPADSAANATQTFTIATNNDDLVEGSETFTVSIAADSSTPLPDGVTVGSADEATATITETDAATVTLSPLSPSAAEGGTFTFTATLSASVSEPVTVRWTAASGTATVTGAGSDLASGQATTATVTFPADSAANATQTFTIATNNDDLVEGSETFTVSIAADDDTALPDGVEIGSADEATATITETDAATVTLSPLSPSAAEGGTFTFTATLSASVSEPVTVRWTAASGTATVDGAGSDLASGQATTATVTFPADSAANATQTFTIATANDTRVEGSETFTVTLGEDTEGGNDLPDGVEIGSADEATATITETDAATVTLSPLSPSVAEGGTFTFTATLNRAVSKPVTVRWTAASGTAAVDGAGSDLASGQPTTNTVTFPADSAANATQTFTIATNNDDLVEGSETFTVTLSPDDDTDLPDGVTVGSADEATATITETDAATVSLSPLSPSVAEGGTFTFTATLSAPVSEPVTVRWTAASGTATVTGPNSDLASGQATTATVTFPADSAANATQTFTIATANDTRVEGSETFTVTLGEDTEGGNDLPDGVEIGSADESTATITEDETATVTLSPLSPSVAEGGTFTFTATLSASVSEPVTVRWTAASGTATVDGAGSDLASGQATTATVTFPADSAANATQTFTIATRDDAVAEGDETFTVRIAADSSTPLPDGVEIGADDEATATITEDETATVTLSPLSPSVAEGGTFTFTATLSAPVSEPVTVRWTATSGTARVDGRNSDLASGQATTATVTFPANSAANATRTFTIATRNDAVAEAPETFTVRISADPAAPLPGGVEVGDADEATATITDTADATTVTLSPSSSSRAEGGTFSFTVTLNGSSSSPVTVRWRARASGNNPATLEGAASDLADGQAIGGRLVTFPANSPPGSRREIDIATRDDAVAEGDETFTVDILDDPARPLPTGVTIGDANEATATITDAADAATVSLSPLSPSQAEGGTFTFTVALNRASSLPVTVRWTAASGTATVSGADSDLADGQAVTGTVIFQANSTASQTFTIATRDDAVAEGDETFTVSIAADPDTALPPGVSIGNANEATATITDAADAATVSLSPLSPSVAEGGTFTFTVALNRASSLPVTVRWTAASGTARVSGEDSDLADGQAVTGTVIFQANSTASQTFTIATRDDAVAEGDETFTVRIAADPDNALPPGVSIGDANEATATITDAADAATVSLSPLSPSVAEGGTFTFTVALNRASSLPVTVRWTAASGTARVLGEDSDLADSQAVTGTVVFQANSTASQTFTIVTRDDAVAEGDETFTVRIAADPDNALPPGVSIGDANEATATITDAADAATVSLSPLSPSVAEGGTFTFTVALNRASSLPVTVRWTAASGTAVVDGPDSDLADGQAAIGSVIFRANSAANATQTFTIATRDDAVAEGDETFTVSIAGHPVAPLPPWITIGDANEATATIEDDDDDGPEPSVLIEPRRIGAGTALRRHVSRFDTMTGTVVRGRLRGSGMKALSFAEDMKNGRMAAGGQLGKTRLGAWVNGAYGDLGGKATGRQADVYGGFDFLGGNGKWLIGALAGHEMADLKIGKATYSASYTHLGLYGGVRLSDRLVFDGALTYGMATPEVTLGDVSASYDANRITARIALTGDFGLAYGLGTGSVKVEPQVGLLYAREALSAFTDSAGGVAAREVLELGRFSFGPRLTWDFDWGQVVGGARVQWDFLQLEDGVDGRLSGAADIGLRFDIAPGVTLDLQGDVDGIGIAEGFRSFGGTIGLQFDLAPDVTLGLQGNVDGIGITDDSRDLGSKGVGVGGRVQLGVRF